MPPKTPTKPRGSRRAAVKKEAGQKKRGGPTAWDTFLEVCEEMKANGPVFNLPFDEVIRNVSNR